MSGNPPTCVVRVCDPVDGVEVTSSAEEPSDDVTVGEEHAVPDAHVVAELLGGCAESSLDAGDCPDPLLAVTT
jgi:hypothetical protein